MQVLYPWRDRAPLGPLQEIGTERALFEQLSVRPEGERGGKTGRFPKKSKPHFACPSNESFATGESLAEAVCFAFLERAVRERGPGE